jgi:hypothetical protein
MARIYSRYRLLACSALVLGYLLAQSRGAVAAVTAETQSQLDRLEIAVVRAEDIRTIRKLQRAYGYYADRGLWEDLADLFTDDAVANYPSGGFDGKASIRAMFLQNLGQGRLGLAEGRIYNHTILQPVVDLAPDGASATGRWRVLGMLGRFGGSATWADSLYRFDYVKQGGQWKIRMLTAYAGSGGSYEQGWVAPRPRPPGAADTSPIRFNLAHPADRPWIDPCEADVSACVVPFPYPNRGGIRQPANPSAVITMRAPPDERAGDLILRAQRLEDEQAVLNLQRTYGYYIDRGQWKQAAELFAPDGSREVEQSGVYIGRERIRRALALKRPHGLRDGELNDHLQLEPIVDVAADGQTARGRVFELAFVGGGGEPARLLQNVQENEYVKRGGKWMIQSLHSYSILATDYDKGWARSALPALPASKVLPPDAPPTVMYEAYPKVFTPPLHFDNASTGRPTQYGTAVTSQKPAADQPTSPQTFHGPVTGKALDAAERQVARVMDYYDIDNLQSAYGYYVEKSLWQDIAALFSERGVLQTDGARQVGRASILEALRALGPEGPVKGRLDSQLQLQPVIEVSADGRSAHLRSRLLRLSRDAEGRPTLGAGNYDNELVKEDGVWKFRRLQLRRAWQVDYRNGWSASSR